MKVISFDVGIKNMAYCIFADTQITDWQVLSLLPPDEPIHRCSFQQTKKKSVTTCSRIAKYHPIFLCDKHAKSVPAPYLFPQTKYKGVKKMKLEELTAFAGELGLVVVAGSKKPEILTSVETHLATWALQPIQKKKANAGEADLISLGHAMKDLFRRFPDDITHVLIENQISPLANRMKTVQGMLAQYFIMRYDGIHVEFISSANKLRMFSKSKKEEKTKEKTQGQTYKEHKKDGITYCDEIVKKGTFQGTESWITCERKKKDDLADCFLQGVWWLTKENNWVI